MLTAGPVSKMASQQEKDLCGLSFEVSRSVITVLREFCVRFRTAGNATAPFVREHTVRIMDSVQHICVKLSWQLFTNKRKGLSVEEKAVATREIGNEKKRKGKNCVSGIWSRKFCDPNGLKEQIQNDYRVWAKRIENKPISKAWTKWRRWGFSNCQVTMYQWAVFLSL
jgi:hypothetical protein